LARVLVTGVAGFIGSHLAERLLARGDTVAGVDNFDVFYDAAIKRRNLLQAQGNPSFSLFEADICQERVVREIFGEVRPEIVVHLAAKAGVRPSIENPGQYIHVNVTGSQHILNACKEMPPKNLVMASSSSVYSGCKNPPFSEDLAADRPLSPYAATKRANELMAFTFSHLYALNISMLRFFTVYGPRQRPDMAIHKFAKLIDAGRPVPMFGAGDTVRDYTYIEDIIGGVVRAIDRPFRYEIFNLGAGRTTDLRGLIALLASSLGKPAIIDEQPLQPGDALETLADISKARRLLGYEPSFTVETGIPRFVEWYRQNTATEAATGATGR
jgi:UDP-glucuronate 4-epimerase